MTDDVEPPQVDGFQVEEVRGLRATCERCGARSDAFVSLTPTIQILVWARDHLVLVHDLGAGTEPEEPPHGGGAQ